MEKPEGWMDGQHQTNIPPPRRVDKKSFGNIYLQLLLCSKSSTSNLPSEITINNECITCLEKIASTLNKYLAGVAEQFQDNSSNV